MKEHLNIAFLSKRWISPYSESLTNASLVTFSFSVHRNCSQLDDGRFQARAIRFWAENVRLVQAKFCDTGHTKKTERLHCEENQNLIDFDNVQGKGKVIQVLFIHNTNLLVFTQHEYLSLICSTFSPG